MSSSADHATSKRLQILSDEEIAALYNRPCFTEDERALYFMLTTSEQELVASFERAPVQLYCILQLGYFKAKQLFFPFTFADVPEDVAHIHARAFASVSHLQLRPLSKHTILKQRQRILDLFHYRLCTPADRQQLLLRAQQAARISSKPVYVFREVVHSLAEHRLVSPGYTFLQEAIVGKALTLEEARLVGILQAQLTPAACLTLDQLFDIPDGLYPITLLKQQPKDFSLKELRREITRGDQLRSLYQLAMRIVPQLEISTEGIKYYATLVSYYSVFRLRQFAAWPRYLYTLCFLIHRYQRLNDNLLSCFIHHVNHFHDEAKTTAKVQAAEERMDSNQDMPKAGLVLKLFTVNQPPETPFSAVQAKAFAILEPQRLTRVAEYIAHEATIDETVVQWEHIDAMARRFKPYLRPIIRAVDLAALRVNAPLLEAIRFLKTTFEAERSLRQIDPADFPAQCIPVRDKRYVYGRTRQGQKQLIADRYEFLIYRQLRNGLESGDLFCRDSVRFRSFEDDLIDAQEWKQHKEALVAQTELARLLQPIQEQLLDLERQLEEHIVAVNQRIDAGDNRYFQITGKGKGKRWILQYPKGSEPINHPLFEPLPHINIGTLLHVVNSQCHFMDCFEHVLGRYRKQVAEDQPIRACLIAWGTNMGLGRMGEISDVAFDLLARTSDNFLRPETLKAANDCVSNAIAALAIFRQYDLGSVVHSSSDGQKFETTIPTFQSRHALKYFGLGKGVVADTLVANQVPINAELISAHDHESHFVLDLLLNNTTDIQPVIHSTDTHGTNQVNFALLYFFNYQFAPRYRDIHEKVRTSLYGFGHPSQYGEVILKPIRKLNVDLIVEEWDSILRILVSLARKTTSQSIIVGKLNAYARRNKTRQALWEIDNILRSVYLLKFVDSPVLRSNVQRALNRGENYHQLRRAVSYANFGKLRFRSEDDLQLWHECSRLLSNCVVFYNTLLLSRLWSRKVAAGDTAGAALIARISPVAWQHINFYGRYEFAKGPDLINLEAMVEDLAQWPIRPMDDGGEV